MILCLFSIHSQHIKSMCFSIYTKHIKPKYFLSSHRSRLWDCWVSEQLEKQLKKHEWFCFSYGSMLLTLHNEKQHAQREHLCKKKKSASAMHTEFSSEWPESTGNSNQTRQCSLLTQECHILPGSKVTITSYKHLATLTATNLPLKLNSPWEKSFIKTQCIYFQCVLRVVPVYFQQQKRIAVISLSQGELQGYGLSKL